MNAATKTELQSWLETAADGFMRGETPTTFPAGVVDVWWEHNTLVAWRGNAKVLTSEGPPPGWTFTAELENGEKLTTHR